MATRSGPTQCSHFSVEAARSGSILLASRTPGLAIWNAMLWVGELCVDLDLPEARMRRSFLVVMMAAAISVGAIAQGVTPKTLPLDNLGLEHLDIVVPDPAASARFYARIFKSALHQQPVRDTVRYFVLLGDLPADRQVGLCRDRRREWTSTRHRALLRAREGVRPCRHGQRAASRRIWCRRCGADGNVARSGSARAAAVPAASRSGDGSHALTAAGRKRRAALASGRRSHAAAREQPGEVAAVLPAYVRDGG